MMRLRAGAVFLLLTACAGPDDNKWHDEDGFRWRELSAPGRGKPGFTLLTPSRTGISFQNTVDDTMLVRNRILAQGAGTCLGDIDGDGMPDIFLARTQGPSALYRNKGGWRFEDATARSGIATANRHSTGCALADVDGDGDLDLVLLALGGPNALFRNDGTGRFTEEDAGLASSAGSTTVTMADVDGDGHLDMYVANYKSYTTLDRMSPQQRSFDQVVREVGPRRFEVREQYRKDYKLVEREDLGGISLVQRADPDFFYRNDGRGRFVREPIMANARFVDDENRQLAEESEDFGLAAMFADLNGDRAPDLYVANDFEDPDQFWTNDGRGNFRMVPWHAVRSASNSAMAVDVADVNRDGHTDIYTVDMLSRDTRRLKTQIPTHTALPKRPGQDRARPQMQRNVLQLNRGDSTFAEVARFAGVGASGWSWSTAFLDVDLDGWEDILVGTGHLWDVMDADTHYRLRNRFQEIDWRRMHFEFPPLPLPNVAFRNKGDLTFEDVSTAWRFDTGDDYSHGMAFADLDGDGDRDVVINRLRKPAAIMRNDATGARVAIRLRGATPNTGGIGSRIIVRGGAVPVQQREVISGGLYMSGSDASLTFATGSAKEVTIEVDWRDGRRSVISGARPNRLYELDQRSASPAEAKPPQQPPPVLFADATAQLGGHMHEEPYYDDYARQLLLPNSFSQLGPGMAWDDIDEDGDDDLLIGAGRMGRLAIFRNDGGRLTRATGSGAPTQGDLTTVLGWPGSGGRRMVLTGVSSYEMPTPVQAELAPTVVTYPASGGPATPLIGGDTASGGPIAAADYTGDGKLDLFVGGRIMPGGYPLSPSSRLYRHDASLVPDTANSKLLAGVGMVSAATFADMNGDGWPDLIVAVEWGTIRIFLNDRGRFRASRELPGLANLYSRWNGVATGDLDGDGRLDIVATSWGRNTGYAATEARPLLLYFGFFAMGAPPSVMFAQDDPRIKGIAPLTSFARLSQALPATAQHLRTFTAYADANIDQVLGTAVSRAVKLGATTMDHMLFLNRGDRFEARSLPARAQLAPAFYAGVADFNGDGKEDVFLSQNFFVTELATPRYDAGRGLLLLGDGRGGLAAMSGQQSGVHVYGEQRGAAYGDFDRDGRLDLVVSQNGAETRLFRNASAVPGLRVRVIGPTGNPTGVGTQMRLVYGERKGPVREIQAGSGYWSQNSAVQLLGGGAQPSAVWFRWPNGKEHVAPIAAGQRELVVRMQ